MDEEFEAKRNFDQECINTLVRHGMEEMEAVFFLGRFLSAKTGHSWTLIQVGEESTSKFFVPTGALEEEAGDSLKN